MDSWDIFEKKYLENNQYQVVISSIFVKNVFFPLYL